MTKLFRSMISAGLLLSCAMPGATQASPLLPNPVEFSNCRETFSDAFWDIFYINGIASTYENARAQLNGIEKEFRRRFAPYTNRCDEPGLPTTFTFKLQYNPTQDRFLDGIETLAIIGNLRTIDAYAAYQSLVDGGAPWVADSAGQVFAVNDEPNAPLVEIGGVDAAGRPILSISRDYFREMIRRTLDASGLEPQDLTAYSAQWARSLGDLSSAQKRCPLVIGYSQGSLIANVIYLDLELDRDPNCTSQVFIGPAAETMVGQAGTTHTTLRNDEVINALRVLGFEPLPGNVSNFAPPVEDDSLNHLLKTYMQNGTVSRAFIDESFDNALFCNSNGQQQEGSLCPLR